MRKATMLLLLAGLALFLGARPAAADPVTPSACDAVTGNLVQNCGFEVFLGVNQPVPNWTGSGDNAWSTGDIAYPDPHSGYYSLGMLSSQPTEALGNHLTQTVATTTGDAYSLSYWLYSDPTGSSANSEGDFNALWNGEAITGALHAGVTDGWTEFTLPDLVASSSSTLLQFDAWDYGSTHVDDFALVPYSAPASETPEPPTIWMLGAGLLGLAWVARRHAVCGAGA